ncbi:hypothetical protein HYT55_01335 [Candidatus Woesearchaeota archaeon]|nr:hypothetical protein [Candidatus Woesearchaeota archaeon]
MIIAALVFLVVFLLLKRIPIYLYAWPLHIVIDIPTHTSNFLPTPFLWPLSSFAFPGISWASREFMVINYLLILGGLLYIVIQNHHGKKK